MVAPVTSRVPSVLANTSRKRRRSAARELAIRARRVRVRFLFSLGSDQEYEIEAIPERGGTNADVLAVAADLQRRMMERWRAWTGMDVKIATDFDKGFDWVKGRHEERSGRGPMEWRPWT